MDQEGKFEAKSTGWDENSSGRAASPGG